MFLDIYHSQAKSSVHTKTCTQMTVLFVIAPNWEQLRRPWVGEVVVHPRNGVLKEKKHKNIWMDLKGFMLIGKN